ILDEPTAGLDAGTEATVIAGLPDRVGVIMVSHRPAVLARADQIITVNPPQPTPSARSPKPVHSGPAHSKPAHSKPAGSKPVRPETGQEEVGQEGQAEPSPKPRWLLAAILLGVLASGSGVALIGVAAWLLAKAAEHPPVLHLMVAVVGVRF